MLEAIHRAIQCAMTAPNHKRTEPSTFKLLSSVESIQSLSQICYNVTFQNEMNKHKGIASEDSTSQIETAARAKAEKKKNRWQNEIPIYLAAVVNGQPNQELDHETDQSTHQKSASLYSRLPFVPPKTERQLEDYASTCAAIQNIQLSLHSEQNPKMGCKWATGPIIHTQAFRSLIQAKKDELVVGLLMIGIPDENHLQRIQSKKRRFRRSLDGDIFEVL